jgi:hypothetical protein
MDARMDALGTAVDRLMAHGERTARLEAATEALRGDVHGMFSRLDSLPNDLLAAVRAHGQDCPGRALAMDRITTRTSRDTPKGGSYPPMPRPAPEPALAVPRWVLWLGGGIGTAIAVAGWALSRLLTGADAHAATEAATKILAP